MWDKTARKAETSAGCAGVMLFEGRWGGADLLPVHSCMLRLPSKETRLCSNGYRNVPLLLPRIRELLGVTQSWFLESPVIVPGRYLDLDFDNHGSHNLATRIKNPTCQFI